MSHFKPLIAGLTLATLLGACATPPMGPSVDAMPPPNKLLDVFKQEDAACRAAAQTQAGGKPANQQQYDAVYAQCMTAKGNTVPGFAPPTPPPPPAPPPMLVPPPPQYDHGLVLKIQTELVRLNLLNGPPDGAYGPKTRGAILDYEKLRGLPRDGIPTPGLLEDLKRN